MDPEVYGHFAGRVLVERYDVGKQLDRGGMGAVYDAIDRTTATRVAIKILHPHLARQYHHLQRFEREAEAAASLGHPCIARVLDFQHPEEGLAFMVMEFLDGAPLSRILREHGLLEPNRAAAIGHDLLGALGAAHSVGIVHRDVKPSNVFLALVGDREEPKLVDFGIAKLMDSAEYTRLTKTGSILGTPAYMPPEQVRGDAVDGRADLYALAATLYVALAGRLPFSAATLSELLGQVITGELPPLRAFRPDVDPALAFTLERALSKEPADRFADAFEMQRALAPFAAQRPTHVIRLAPAAGANTDDMDGLVRAAAIANAETLGPRAAAETPTLERAGVLAAPTPTPAGELGSAVAYQATLLGVPTAPSAARIPESVLVPPTADPLAATMVPTSATGPKPPSLPPTRLDLGSAPTPTPAPSSTSRRSVPADARRPAPDPARLFPPTPTSQSRPRSQPRSPTSIALIFGVVIALAVGCGLGGALLYRATQSSPDATATNAPAPPARENETIPPPAAVRAPAVANPAGSLPTPRTMGVAPAPVNAPPIDPPAPAPLADRSPLDRGHARADATRHAPGGAAALHAGGHSEPTEVEAPPALSHGAGGPVDPWDPTYAPRLDVRTSPTIGPAQLTVLSSAVQTCGASFERRGARSTATLQVALGAQGAAPTVTETPGGPPVGSCVLTALRHVHWPTDAAGSSFVLVLAARSE